LSNKINQGQREKLFSGQLMIVEISLFNYRIFIKAVKDV